ncbi:hypothetical protein BDC45DRAFT_542043 [Circinella umbellata]|nr:hypothetical protein BDC45DRAFT_542043 [Circinella umbellata]
MYFKPKRYPKTARRPAGVFTEKAKKSKMYGIRSKSKFARLKSFKDLIVEHIKDQEVQEASVALSQSSITTSELRELDKHVWCWLGTLVKYVDLGHIKIWNPLWVGSTDIYAKYHLDKVLRNYWQIYLDDVEQINPFIEAGGKLFISSRGIIGSSCRSCDDTRRDDFYIQMIIDVDKFQR